VPPYRHFLSADTLIAALAAHGFSRLSAAMRATPARTLSAIGTIYVRFAAAHSELYRAMFYFPADQLVAFPELARAADEAFHVLNDAIGDSAGSGNRLLPTAAWAYVHGLSELLINRLTLDLDTNDDETMELLMSAFDLPAQRTRPATSGGKKNVTNPKNGPHAKF
jgi:AcrR family transcriptional regulator